MNIEIKGVHCMSSLKYVGDELEMIMTDLAVYGTNILFRLRQWSEIFFFCFQCKLMGRDNSAEGTVRKGTFYLDKSFFS